MPHVHVSNICFQTTYSALSVYYLALESQLLQCERSGLHPPTVFQSHKIVPGIVSTKYMPACADMKQASESTRVSVDFADVKEALTTRHTEMRHRQLSLLRVPVSPCTPWSLLWLKSSLDTNSWLMESWKEVFSDTGGNLSPLLFPIQNSEVRSLAVEAPAWEG